MGWLRRLHRTIVGSAAVDEFDEECAFHLEEHIAEGVSRGLTAEDARRDARQRFGNLLLAREQTHDADTVRWLTDLGQDLRYAVRSLRRAPVFTLTAFAALTLGIGANTAMFAVVNTVLVKPPPYPDPARIVALGYTFQGIRVPAPLTSPAKFSVWRQGATALQDIAGLRSRPVNLADGRGAEQVQGMQVNTEFFTLLGARMAHGRPFTAEEDRPGGAPVVVLAHQFWQRRFGSASDIIGRTISIDGGSAVIVGVMDAGFDTTIFNVSPDLWVPLRLDPNSTEHPPSLVTMARLRSGISLETAQAEAQLIALAFHRKFPDASGPNDTFWIAPFQKVMIGDLRLSLLVLLGAVGMVWLIACANVANLLLVRASVRHRELAIRSAIGASRWRITRQLLTEGLVLSLTGGTLGLVVGMVAIRALLTIAPGDLPRIGPGGIGVAADWRVLAFTVVVSMMTALALGVWPALRISRGDLGKGLASTRGRSESGVRHRTARSLLIVSEMALALVLLIGAALLIRTFVALRTVDRGFDLHHVITMRLAGADAGLTKTSVVSQLVANGVQRMVAIPGVVSAAATCCLPLLSDWGTSFVIVGRPSARPAAVTQVSYRIISSGYFDVLKIPLRRGRPFTERDHRGAPAVAMINQAMARQFWPSGDPLGDRLVAFPGLVPDDEPARQIVGIVDDVRDGMPLDREPRPTIYVPLPQLLDRENGGWSLVWLVRTRPAPYALAAAVQEQLRQVSGGLPVAGVLSLDELSGQATAPTHFQMIVLALFAGAAVVLAVIGVYGVTAYTVQQRQHEIGIRMALGATGHQVRLLFLKEGVQLALCGVIIGLVLAFGLTRLLATLLFGVTPHDRVVFITATVVLATVVLGAVWSPARRATLVDPIRWLRDE